MSYWSKQRPTRRSLIKGAGFGAAGIAGAVLIGCGSDEEEAAAPAPAAAPAAPAAAATAAPAAATAAPAAATVTARAPATAPVRGTLRWSGANTDMNDIHQGTHVGAQNLAQMSLDGLWQMVEPTPGDLLYAPMLADSLEQPDELTYIFHIRENTMFHPPVNRTFTSEDAKLSLERMATDDPRFTRASWLDPVASYETPDQQTFVIKTKEPVAGFLDLIANPWTCMIAKEQVDLDGDQFQTYIGTGPFINEVADVNNEYVFKRFQNYWDNGPYFDEIRLNWIQDKTAEQSAFRAGEIHSIGGVPAATKDKFQEQNPNATEHKVPSAGIGIVAMNNLREPYNDIRVRQAIALAADIPGWMDVLVAGQGFLTGPISKSFKRWAPQDKDLMYHEANAAEAKKLFDAAVPGGFTVNTGSIGGIPRYIGSSENLKADLEALGAGITVNVEAMTQNDYVKRLFVTHDFDIITGQDFSPDNPDRLLDRLHSQGSGNYTGYANAEVDSLFEKQRKTVNLEERREIVSNLMKILVKEVPTFYTYVPWSFDFSQDVWNWRRSAITANDERWNARQAYFKS